MVGIDPRRLVWGFHRSFLRHGVAFGVVLMGAVIALVMLVAVSSTWLRLQHADEALAEQRGELGRTSNPEAPEAWVDVLPLPDAEQRFELTRRILAGLEDAGFEPDQIRFKFEDMDDAGLLRQTAVFKLKARWSEIAQALASLQIADRSLYIAKLRLERETPGASLVLAEIQVAVALTQDVADVGGAP